MDIKLIALDMDGTLLEPDHIHVSPRNIAALRAASALGVKIVIASGRNICLIEDAAAAIGVVDYAISANGAGARDWRTGEWLYHVGLPTAQWQAMLKLMHARGLAVETYADGKAYLTQADLNGLCSLGFPPEFSDFFVRRVEVVEDVVAALEGKTMEKFNLFFVPPADRAALMANLSATGPVVFANGEPTNLEMTAPGADKGVALAHLCAHLGIAPEQVMAFGDGDNDLGMLSWAGWSFAMENGSAGAKAAAKHRAPHNSESGVGRMIEQYVLEH